MNILKLRSLVSASAVSSVFVVGLALSLVGCAAPPAFQVTQAPVTRIGTVESIQSQAVQNTPNAAGAIGGGLVGGLLGNQVGGGSGRTAATVVGALGGAHLGNQAASRNTSMVWTIRVRYDDGTFASIQQTSAPGLRIGDRVRVSNNSLELLRS